MRIGSIIIFRLSELWKAKFSILCDVIFLVRLRGEIWYWSLLGVKGFKLYRSTKRPTVHAGTRWFSGSPSSDRSDRPSSKNTPGFAPFRCPSCLVWCLGSLFWAYRPRVLAAWIFLSIVFHADIIIKSCRCKGRLFPWWNNEIWRPGSSGRGVITITSCFCSSPPVTQ